MIRRSSLFFTALSCLVLTLSGCGGSGGTAITKQEEEMMRRPAGQTAMPPEAMQAMQRANQEAAQRAAQQRGGQQPR